MSQDSKDKIKMALTAVVNRDYLINTIGWNEIDPNIRTILFTEFYGFCLAGYQVYMNAPSEQFREGCR